VARRGETMARSGLKTLCERCASWGAGAAGTWPTGAGPLSVSVNLSEFRGPAQSTTAARLGFVLACRALLGMHTMHMPYKLTSEHTD
jgi:hypothetical protein